MEGADQVIALQQTDLRGGAQIARDAGFQCSMAAGHRKQPPGQSRAAIAKARARHRTGARRSSPACPPRAKDQNTVLPRQGGQHEKPEGQGHEHEAQPPPRPEPGGQRQADKAGQARRREQHILPDEARIDQKLRRGEPERGDQRCRPGWLWLEDKQREQAAENQGAVEQNEQAGAGPDRVTQS